MKATFGTTAAMLAMGLGILAIVVEAGRHNSLPNKETLISIAIGGATGIAVGWLSDPARGPKARALGDALIPAGVLCIGFIWIFQIFATLRGPN